MSCSTILGGCAIISPSNLTAPALLIPTIPHAVIVPSKDTFNNDAWLDWRGKGQVDSAPGSVRPRNMFEVVSMRDDNGSRPVVRGSGMDQWMESRGKKMTPAPNAGDPRELFEVRVRGRAAGQAAAKLEDTRTCGLKRSAHSWTGVCLTVVA